MYKGKRFLAVIPARGGSKRLPNKNRLILSGKPLVSWTIEASNNSHYIDKTIVSSDDHTILSIAQNEGVEILLRPSSLSTDKAGTYDVIKHVLDSLCSDSFDYLVLLQPTSPLRTTEHIDEAIEQLYDQKAEAIISVTEMEHSPLWSNTLPQNGCMKNFISSELKGKRSQDLDCYYRLNGAIYIVNIKQFLLEHEFFCDKSYAYLMPPDASVDIDTMLDFVFAEALMGHRKSK